MPRVLQKQFMATCDYGYIETTDKLIEFKGDERHETPKKTTGTTVYGELDLGKTHVTEIILRLKRIITPADKKFFLNGEEIKSRKTFKTFETVLETVVPSRENPRVMSRSKRKTIIDLYELEGTEKPWLYELGMPVQHVGEGLPWHVNVNQKVWQNINRDTVSEAYLDDLFASIVNNCHGMIPKDKASANFVRIGLGDATKEAAEDLIEKAFGDKVFFKSTDYRANEAAMEEGVVLPHEIFDADTRRHLNDIGVVSYASQEFKVHLDGEKLFKNQTPRMDWFAKIVKEIANDVLKHDIEVKFVSGADMDAYAYYNRLTKTMAWNVSKLGKNFFEEMSPRAVGYIIHELAHDAETEEGTAHLTMEYVDEMQRIGGLIGFKGINSYEALVA